MIKFNLEKALAGDKVVTRDNREVSQIVEFKGTANGYTLYGVVGDEVESWKECGRFLALMDSDNPYDLFMAPKKLSGWVNIYPNLAGPFFYESKGDADRCASIDRIACIDLSQYNEGDGL